jgi:hypothetical protein
MASINPLFPYHDPFKMAEIPDDELYATVFSVASADQALGIGSPERKNTSLKRNRDENSDQPFATPEGIKRLRQKIQSGKILDQCASPNTKLVMENAIVDVAEQEDTPIKRVQGVHIHKLTKLLWKGVLRNEDHPDLASPEFHNAASKQLRNDTYLQKKAEQIRELYQACKYPAKLGDGEGRVDSPTITTVVDLDHIATGSRGGGGHLYDPSVMSIISTSPTGVLFVKHSSYGNKTVFPTSITDLEGLLEIQNKSTVISTDEIRKLEISEDKKFVFEVVTPQTKASIVTFYPLFFYQSCTMKSPEKEHEIVLGSSTFTTSALFTFAVETLNNHHFSSTDISPVRYVEGEGVEQKITVDISQKLSGITGGAKHGILVVFPSIELKSDVEQLEALILIR